MQCENTFLRKDITKVRRSIYCKDTPTLFCRGYSIIGIEDGRKHSDTIPLFHSHPSLISTLSIYSNFNHMYAWLCIEIYYCLIWHKRACTSFPGPGSTRVSTNGNLRSTMSFRFTPSPLGMASTTQSDVGVGARRQERPTNLKEFDRQINRPCVVLLRDPRDTLAIYVLSRRSGKLARPPVVANTNNHFRTW